MILARLLDTEGRVIKEMAFPDARRIIKTASPRKFHMMIEEDPLECLYDEIEYEFERIDGGGTHIYRRITPLWRKA